MSGMEERGDGSRAYIGWTRKETRDEYTGTMVKFLHDYYAESETQHTGKPLGLLIPRGTLAVVLHDIGYTEIKTAQALAHVKHRIAIPTGGGLFHVLFVQHPFLSWNLSAKEKKSLRLHRLYVLNLMSKDYDNLDILLDK